MALTQQEVLKLSKVENLFNLIRQHKDTQAIGELAKLLRDAKELGRQQGKEEIMVILKEKAGRHADENIADND